jgi:uncharacterized membrane protein YhhN
MRKHSLNVVSGRALLVLAAIALASVLSGFLTRPQRDEGPAAHVFQLSVVAFVAFTALFLATTDWRGPSRSTRPLFISTGILVIAFGALYLLEHVGPLVRG